jgi:hypothetical protein
MLSSTQKSSILDIRMKKSGITISLLADDITNQKGDFLLISIPKNFISEGKKDSLYSQVVIEAGEEFKNVNFLKKKIKH